MAIPTDPPKTTQRSWGALVRAHDEDFDRDSLKPITYEFSNGRQFRQPVNPYGTAT